MVTFVKPSAVRSKNPGCCYKKAGFRHVGESKVEKHLAFQLLPEQMPPACAAHGAQLAWDMGAPIDPVVMVDRPVRAETEDDGEQFAWPW